MNFRLPSKSLYLALMLLLLILASWFGARSLDADPMWVDEVIAIQRAGIASYMPINSLGDIWARTSEISDQVPAYYTLLYLWSRLVGDSPFALRVLSLLLGIITIASVYQIGKALQNSLAGFAAALALSSSAFYILFLHEMRTYALLLCLIALLIWFYWLIVYKKPYLWAQLGLVLATSLLLYSYYLSIIVILCLCLYHLLFVQKGRAWWRIVILFGLAGLLYLPWILNAYSILTDENRNAMRQIHTVDIWAGIVRFLAAYSNKNIAALLIIGLFSVRLREKNPRFVWFILLGSVLALMFLNEPLGVFVNLRYSLFLWIPLSLLVGFGMARIAQYGLPVQLLLVVIAGIGVFSVLDQKLTNEYDLPIRYLPWDDLTALTQNYEQAGDSLIFLALIEGDDWEGVHEERVMPHYFHDSAIQPFFIEDVRNLPDEAFLREGQALSSDAERLWLSYAPKLRSWRTGLFQDMLSENDFVRCGNFADNEQLYLDLYLHPRAFEQHPRLAFGSDESSMAELSLVQALPEQATENFYLVHGWRLSDAFPRSTYSLALHIWDSAGNLVAQADYGLPTEPFACTLSQIPVESLAAGRYEIRSFVYDWQSGEHLPMLDGTDTTVLGEFQVGD